jgi:hypothetical protein
MLNMQNSLLATTDFVVYTPGKSSGRPLTLEPIPDLTPLRDDADELDSAVAMVHGALAPVVASGKSQKQFKQAGNSDKRSDILCEHASNNIASRFD